MSYYTNKALLELLENAGFRIEEKQIRETKPSVLLKLIPGLKRSDTTVVARMCNTKLR